ncbi:unnamed protein product [Symbiodinium sp. CCMP2592]|nr:unnamed protein product [Symbiodinium sp. CCMP2592]
MIPPPPRPLAASVAAVGNPVASVQLEAEEDPEQVVYFDEAQDQEAFEEVLPPAPPEPDLDQVVYFDEGAGEEPDNHFQHQAATSSWHEEASWTDKEAYAQTQHRWAPPHFRWQPQGDRMQDGSWNSPGPPTSSLGAFSHPGDGLQMVKEEKSDLPASLRQGVPRVVEPRLTTPPNSGSNARSPVEKKVELKRLAASEVERGMVVVFDENRKGWVDNCFSDIDEFWLCDEDSLMTVFNDGEESIRTFSAAELGFTGEWSPHVEISTEVVITQEIVERLSKQPEWEKELEEKTGIPIMVDSPRQKVAIGPATPPKVKDALSLVNSELSKLDQQIWSADQPAPPSEPEQKPPEKEAAPPAEPEQGTQEGETLLSQVQALLPEAQKERTPKRKRRLSSSEDSGTRRSESKRRLVAGSTEMFRLGFETALKQLEETRAAVVKTETPQAKQKDKDFGPPAEFASLLRETAGITTGAKSQPQGQTPERSGPPAQAEAPTTKAPERSGDGPRTVMEWAEEQAQFAGLTPLPPNWIRVRRKRGSGVYFVNVRTGKSTFDFPDGWVKMKSRSNGATYYWNPKTGASQLEVPPDAADVVTQKPSFRPTQPVGVPPPASARVVTPAPAAPAAPAAAAGEAAPMTPDKAPPARTAATEMVLDPDLQSIFDS